MPRRRVPVRLCALLLLAGGAVAAGRVAAGTVAVGAAGGAAAEKNLLRNAGFESGEGQKLTAWEARFDPSVTPPPTFGRQREAVHDGQHSALISSGADGGRPALTQLVTDPPRGATVAKLVGWIRVEGAGAPPAAGGAADVAGTNESIADVATTTACFGLAFPESGEASAARSFQTAEVPVGNEWTRVDLDVPVPKGARTWAVSCTLRGPGRACFDDLLLTASDQPADLLGCVLARGTGRYIVEARDDAPAPWISFSVPFPFAGQTPLALALASDPPGAIERLELHADRDNRPLRVVLKAMRRGDIVRLRADSLVLLRDRPLSSGAGVKLPPTATPTASASAARKLPEDVRPHLQHGPGVAADDPVLTGVARGFSQRDLAGFTADLRSFLEFKLSNSDAGRKVRGVDPIETNMALSVKYANLTASLLIANGVPARILACTGVSGALQEHYLVEAWTPALGWSRLESTAAFPWGDTRNVVLRVVYPDAPRTMKDVPIYCEADPAVHGYPNFAPDTLFWQSGRLLGTFAAERQDVERLEAAARGAFEGAVRAAVAGDSVRFVPESGALAGGERFGKFVEVIEREIAP